MPDAQFDPFDQDAIRDRIQWVLTGKEVRQSLQSHSITQAETFNWDLTAKEAISNKLPLSCPASTESTEGTGEIEEAPTELISEAGHAVLAGHETHSFRVYPDLT